jgi:hypothetical protein
VLALYKKGDGCLTPHTPTLGATSLHLSTPLFSLGLVVELVEEQGLSHQGRLVSLGERIFGMNNTTMFSSKFKLSYLLYSCAIELEYSFHVIILTYELAYSLCVMILACSCDMILVYELDHSSYARVLSYKTLCLNIHMICLLGLRAKYRWWFIMPSGMPKFFTCRSVGSGTQGTWVVTIYTGEVPGYIGWVIACPFHDRGVGGRW